MWVFLLACHHFHNCWCSWEELSQTHDSTHSPGQRRHCRHLSPLPEPASSCQTCEYHTPQQTVRRERTRYHWSVYESNKILCEINCVMRGTSSEKNNGHAVSVRKCMLSKKYKVKVKMNCPRRSYYSINNSHKKHQLRHLPGPYLQSSLCQIVQHRPRTDGPQW